MEIDQISRGTFLKTVGLGIIASVAIVMIAAGIGRATVNLQGALTEKPDIAVHLLLEEDGVGRVELLKEGDTERHYLAHTDDGPVFVILKKGETEWYISSKERLHETSDSSSSEAPVEETPESL